ncbi:MAG: polysaccharide biosynthesis/export family protein [Vicinamibacterales bacterium]
MTTKSISILETLVLAALVLAPAAAGAQAKPAGASDSTAAVTNARPWTNDEYRLGPGDKLRVEVYREAQLSQSLQVRPDGKITLPLVGDVAAAGKTPIELRDGLTASLKEYVTNPVVTVIVVEATAAQVYVIGEVTTPGTLVMQGPMTVLQALAQAGGLREFAHRSDIRILRKMPTGIRTIGFDYKRAVKGETEPVFLQPGDTVVVP